MYLTQSIIDGLKILGFDKETIKRVAREKSLEEIFLSTLFMNYLIVLVVFLISIMLGSITIGGREINQPVFFGLLMVYPFVFNLWVYFVYGFFGLFAELLNSHKHVKPLISVGFHTGIAYTILIYIIALISSFDPSYGLFLLGVFIVYFLIVMFVSISEIYGFSVPQTLIIVFLPFILFLLLILVLMLFFDLRSIIGFFFV